MINSQKNKIYTGSRERQSNYDVFYKVNNQKKPVLIFSHGFKGFKDHGCFDLMANFWAENNFAFLKFNFSFNGGTVENPIDFPDLEAFSENNYTTELNDLGVIIDLIAQGKIFPDEEADTNEIYLMGHSRGGGITILKGLQDDRVKKFISLGAISTLKRFPIDKKPIENWEKMGIIYFENKRTHQQMPMKYQFYDDFIKNENLLNIEKQIKNLNKPYLNLHGDQDETIAVDEAYAIKTWQPKTELHIIPNGMHSFGSSHPWLEKEMPKDFEKAMQIALNFLKK